MAEHRDRRVGPTHPAVRAEDEWGRVALAPGQDLKAETFIMLRDHRERVKWNENTKSTASLSPTLGSEQAVRGMDASRQRSCMQGGGRQGGRAKSVSLQEGEGRAKKDNIETKGG